jgi:hypothetical protein
MVRLILPGTAHFVKQRGGLQNEAFLDVRIATDQSAVHESVIELQRKFGDSADAREVRRDEIRPFREFRQTG